LRTLYLIKNHLKNRNLSRNYMRIVKVYSHLNGFEWLEVMWLHLAGHII